MFKNLFKKKQPEKSPETEKASQELPLAFAALLIEAARSDEHYTDHEKQIIDKALTEKFSLTGDDAVQLRGRAEEAQKNALDLQRFTKIVKSMDEAAKIDLIELLWKIVLTDGVRDPFEDTLIRRVCGLIYVDDRESGNARQRVQQMQNSS